MKRGKAMSQELEELYNDGIKIGKKQLTKTGCYKIIAARLLFLSLSEYFHLYLIQL